MSSERVTHKDVYHFSKPVKEKVPVFNQKHLKRAYIFKYLGSCGVESIRKTKIVQTIQYFRDKIVNNSKIVNKIIINACLVC